MSSTIETAVNLRSLGLLFTGLVLLDGHLTVSHDYLTCHSRLPDEDAKHEVRGCLELALWFQFGLEGDRGRNVAAMENKEKQNS